MSQSGTTETPIVGSTAPTEQELLREKGFVRVTGLGVFSVNGFIRTIGVNLPPTERGRFCRSSHFITVVTMGGDVWLASSLAADIDDNVFYLVCPNGPGTLVPCALEHFIPTESLLRRLTDPFCDAL